MARVYSEMHFHREKEDDDPIKIRGREVFSLRRRASNAAPYGWGLRLGGNYIGFYGYGVETIDAIIDALQKVRAKAVEMEERDEA